MLRFSTSHATSEGRLNATLFMLRCHGARGNLDVHRNRGRPHLIYAQHGGYLENRLLRNTVLRVNGKSSVGYVFVRIRSGTAQFLQILADPCSSIGPARMYWSLQGLRGWAACRVWPRSRRPARAPLGPRGPRRPGPAAGRARCWARWRSRPARRAARRPRCSARCLCPSPRCSLCHRGSADRPGMLL